MALKLQQRYIYQTNTFQFMTENENGLYNTWKKYKNDDPKNKNKAKQRLSDEINTFKDIRENRKPKNKDGTNKDISFIDIAIDNLKNNKSANLISIFENELTRWIEGNKADNKKTIASFSNPIYNKYFLHGIIMLKVGQDHHNILKQIIDKGALIDGVLYRVFTASAGQQRDEKLMLVEKSILTEYLNSVAMCGLSEDRINQMGGVNTGKYLAYRALCVSSSLPINIDIGRVIVVDDLEVNVDKPVEFIDNQTFKSQMVAMPDKHNLTDGAGMILPDLMDGIKAQLKIDYDMSGFQIRSPWIKGAVFPFDFQEFAKEHDSFIVTDIYGVKHDIAVEDVQMILTKSQFKMWRYYESWDEYQSYFRTNNLSFSVTAVNNPSKDIMKLSYQFLQTLDRDQATADNIGSLCHYSIRQYQVMHNDVGAACEALGAVAENDKKKPLQEAVQLCPELLNDDYVRNQIAGVVRSYKKQILAGQIEVNGFYGYAQPDLFGFCEYLFLGEQHPKGLIPNDSIYCDYYKDAEYNEVDCLRSPHLGNEHTVRKLHKSEECQKWFKHCEQNVIFSCQDYLMLALQGDVDGDSVALVPNKIMMDMIKPHNVLHYQMFQAPEQEINSVSVGNTLVKSFEIANDPQNVGVVSNTISKLWNQDQLDEKTIQFIKALAMLTNYVIDLPKTQKGIELPLKLKDEYSELCERPLPYFFKYAKGSKKIDQPNGSVMNLITQHIEENTKYCRYYYDVPKSDYSKLQSRNQNGKVIVNRYTDQYKQLQRLCYKYGRSVQHMTKQLKQIDKKQEDTKNRDTQYDLFYSICLMDMLAIYADQKELANALVDLCYCQQTKIGGISNLLWNCVGDVIVDNIIDNLGEKDYKRQTRTRTAYNSKNAVKDVEYIQAIKSKLDDKLVQAKPIIYQHDVDKMMQIKNEKHRKLYFVLLCLCKIFTSDKDKVNHIVFIHRGKKSKITTSRLAKMSGLDKSNSNSINSSLDWLKKNHFIKPALESKVRNFTICNYNYDLVGETVLTVNNAWNPMLYYQACFEGKTIFECDMCGRDYIKTSNNQKVCPACQTAHTQLKLKEANEKRKAM